MPTTRQALMQLWQCSELDTSLLDRLQFHGNADGLPASFAVGSLAAASIGASALAASQLFCLRGGDAQNISVNVRHAALECRSERYFQVNGAASPDLWDPLAGSYRCGDGRYLRIHTNFSHHRDGVLELLQCSPTREAIAQALQSWAAIDFETLASERGLCVAAMRSFAEWDQHPQAMALAQMPIFSLEKIGEAPPQPLGPAKRPLAGIRVLELTRIIAGPVCGRTLAGHGADVLLVNAPQLPNIEGLLIDTGRGKRSALLDLTEAAQAEQLRQLAQDADVFIQGYRPGGLTQLGFGSEALARMRPGMISVELSAYGHLGPWAGKRGFDSLVQTATGFNHAEAMARGKTEPQVLPMQILDHASGYIMALGAMAALYKRATEGGSWRVRVSLAQTGLWLRQLGQKIEGLHCPDASAEEVAALLETTPSGFGPLTAMRHSAKLELTPAYWNLPSSPLGSHRPQWAAEP